jgi:hypothetical protein
MIILEFAIDRTIIRRYDVDEEQFKDALYHTTPPTLRETGLPFDKENVLHTKKYVLALWKYFFMSEEPEILAYTGRFIDSLTVTNYKDNYSVTKRRKRSASDANPATVKKKRWLI